MAGYPCCCGGCLAAFSYTENGLAIDFTDESPGTPSAWEWDFGDGDTSTEQNPTHTYDGSGAYLVFLTITVGETQCRTFRVVELGSSSLCFGYPNLTSFSMWLVEISGVTDLGCSLCSRANGSYIVVGCLPKFDGHGALCGAVEQGCSSQVNGQRGASMEFDYQRLTLRLGRGAFLDGTPFPANCRASGFFSWSIDFFDLPPRSQPWPAEVTYTLQTNSPGTGGEFDPPCFYDPPGTLTLTLLNP